MKKLVFAIVCMFMGVATVNAEETTSVTPEGEATTLNTEMAETVLGQNTVSFVSQAPVMTSSLLTQEYQSNKNIMTSNYKNTGAYKSARNLRTAGIVTTCVGGAVAAFCGTAAIVGANGDDAGSFLGGASFVMPAFVGAGVAAVGGILWGVGQHKMNKVKAASNGVGLALTF